MAFPFARRGGSRVRDDGYSSTSSTLCVLGIIRDSLRAHGLEHRPTHADHLHPPEQARRWRMAPRAEVAERGFSQARSGQLLRTCRHRPPLGTGNRSEVHPAMRVRQHPLTLILQYQQIHGLPGRGRRCSRMPSIGLVRLQRTLEVEIPPSIQSVRFFILKIGRRGHGPMVDHLRV